MRSISARESAEAPFWTLMIISTPPSQRSSMLSKPRCMSSVSPKISSETAAVMIAATVSVTLRRKLAQVSRNV